MRIDEIIRERGISKTGLARKLCISPQRFNDVLHGRRPFPIKWVIPVCKFVGCDPNSFFEWEDSNVNYLSKDYTKLVVMDVEREKVIAVVTNDEITTAGDNIVVKLTPTYD